MAFESVDRPLLWEGGYWGETVRAWCGQGAPLAGVSGGINLESAEGDEQQGAWNPLSEAMFDDLPLEPGAEVALEFDPAPRRIPLNSFVSPCFEYEILEQRGDTIVARDERGHLRRERRGGVSIAQILKPLVSNHQDWEKVKAERLRLDIVGRLPPDWPQVRHRLKNRDYVLTVGGHSGLCGFYHPARYLMGPEALLCAFYDQPELVGTSCTIWRICRYSSLTACWPRWTRTCASCARIWDSRQARSFRRPCSASSSSPAT